MIDLDAYFQRIGYSGERTATLATLRALLVRHTESIAFENLNPLLRWPVLLDPASLQQKLVREQRGGYCFEHNLLLSHVLQLLGFRVTGLAARVLWNAPENVTGPRGHMLLRVELDGTPYLADVGFGSMTLTGPLRLEPDVEQATPHEPFRLLRMGDTFVMQAKVRKEWKALYRFDLQEQLLPDYEVTNWYLSTHPRSHFVTGLVAARPARDRRFGLRNLELSVHHLGGASERRVLRSVTELRGALEESFLLKLPDAPELDAALGRVVAGQPRS